MPPRVAPSAPAPWASRGENNWGIGDGLSVIQRRDGWIFPAQPIAAFVLDLNCAHHPASWTELFFRVEICISYRYINSYGQALFSCLLLCEFRINSGLVHRGFEMKIALKYFAISICWQE